jgi:integrase
VQRLHERICEENGLYQANRLLERIRAIYNKAIEWGWQGGNPAAGIKKFKEKARDRFLQPHELPYFFEALGAEGNAALKDYILLSLLTGARKANMLAMRWDEISLEQRQWRIPETKNGDPVLIPLSPQAIEILHTRKAQATGAWVFPSAASSKGHLQDPKKAWQRLLKRAEIYQLIDLLATKENWSDKAVTAARDQVEENLPVWLETYRKTAATFDLDITALGLPDLRIHDLRRSLGSWQAVTGASSYVIGKSLGHKSQQATAIYARLNLDPVRESVEKATAAMLEAGRSKTW